MYLVQVVRGYCLWSGTDIPDPQTGEGLRRPSPDSTPLGARALRAYAPLSGPLALHRPWDGLSPQIFRPSAAYAGRSLYPWRLYTQKKSLKINLKYKISPVRDWRSTLHSRRFCQVQSHVKQKLGQISGPIKFRYCALV